MTTTSDSLLQTISLTASVGDPEGTRTITAIVALLIVIGIALLMLAIWLFKVTRPDPELLGPLELMGERKWLRGDPVWQRRRLDEVRPEHARPLQPSPAPPDLDVEFDEGPTASGFDDLQHDQPAEDADDATRAAPRPVPRYPIGELGHRPAVESEPDDDTDGPGPAEPERAFGPPRVRRPSSATPIGIVRPTPDDLPDRELDPEVLEAARAELDAELERGRRRPGDSRR